MRQHLHGIHVDAYRIRMQELSGIAEANAGLEVATTKCLDRCKQGPTLAVSNPGSDPLVCVSKDKPPKRERKLRNLLAF